MRKKLFILIGLLFFVFISGGAVAWLEMRAIRINHRWLDEYQHQIRKIMNLFYLSTTVQQQQVELRFHMIDDVNPLVGNVQEMDGILKSLSRDMNDPEMVESCVKCHARMGDEKWKELSKKIEELQSALDVYKQQVSDFVMASGTGMRDLKEQQAVATAKTIVALSHAINYTFDSSLNYISRENNRRLSTAAYSITAIFIFGFFAVHFLFIRFYRRIVGPILKLEEAAGIVSRGEYPERLDIRTRDEIEILAETFNSMVETLRRITGEREKLLQEAKDFNLNLEKRIEDAKQELQQAQEGMIRSEKLTAMGTLAAGVSHEISNPIHIIQGICSLAIKDVDPQSGLASDLRMIEGEAVRCQKIVNSLLDFARQKESDMAPASLGRLVLDTIELMKHQKEQAKVTFSADLDEGLPDLLMDANQMKQVLVNLMLNAVQAMPREGVVTIRTRRTAHHGRPAAEIRVEDSGAGIPPDIIHKIFDPFFTTKKGKKGTGLGLAVSYRIVEKHNGLIRVESEVGQGTTFIITLPLDRQNESENQGSVSGAHA